MASNSACCTILYTILHQHFAGGTEANNEKRQCSGSLAWNSKGGPCPCRHFQIYSYVSGKGANRILRRWEVRMHVTNCSIEKGVKLKGKLQSPGTGSAAARRPRLLCYRLTVFSRHLRLISRSFLKKKSARFLKCYFFTLSYFFEIA